MSVSLCPKCEVPFRRDAHEDWYCDVCGFEPDADEMLLKWELLSDIEMRSIVFVDRPLWQASAFHLLVGRKGVGKGTMLADLAARFTRGELGPRRTVFWIGSEDSTAVDIKPRLLAAEGDSGRVIVVREWIQFPRDIGKLGNTLAQIGDVGLVIIDPVGNHITGKNSNSDTDIRDAIAPLNDLADEHETIVVGIRHLSEKETGNGAIAAILGASAWVQVPRAVLAIVSDNDDPSISHVQCIAGNRLPPDTPGREFRIEGVLLDGLENEITRAVWVGDSTKNVEALLGESRQRPSSKSAAARELILDALEAAPGRRIESDELDARIAEEIGLATQTIRNQRADLKNAGLIRPVSEKDEAGHVVQWFIERTNAPRKQGVSVTGQPVTDSREGSAENGSTKPVTVQNPRYNNTVTGEEESPVTDSVGTGLLDGDSTPAGGGSPRFAECVLRGSPYDSTRPLADGLVTCPACVALRRGLVTQSEAEQIRLLQRLVERVAA